METYFQQVIEIIVTLPASLFFHLGLAAFLISAILPAFIGARVEGNPAGTRLTFGLLLLILGQVALFTAGGLAWQAIIVPHILPPVLERFVFSISLLAIGWMWAYPYRKPTADAACTIAGLLLAVFFTISISFRTAQGGVIPFNRSGLDLFWAGISLTGAVGFTIPLAIRKPAGWLLGVTSLVVLGLGILGHLFLDSGGGDLPGAVRLAQLIAFPLVPLLPYRGRFSRLASAGSDGSPKPPLQERRRFSTDGKTLRAFLALASETDPEKLGPALTRMIAHVMVADLCILATQPDRSDSICLETGYDLIRESVLSGVSIPSGEIPQLVAAIEQGKMLRLSSEVEIPRDLKTIAAHLKLDDPGNLLSVPLLDNQGTPVGSVLLLSPYSHRTWSLEDQTFLTPISTVLAPIIERVRNMAILQNELTRTHEEMQHALANTLASASQPGRLVDELPGAVEPVPALQEPDLETLLAIQQEYQDIITRLQSENIHLQEVAAHAYTNRREWGSGEDWQMEKDLHQALDQVARLQNALEEAQARIGQLEEDANAPSGQEPDAFLDAMRPVDLLEVVDQILDEFSPVFRDKSLDLFVSLPEFLPSIQANPEAILQVCHYFISNASQVSSPGSAISLHVDLDQPADQSGFVVLSLTDSGGGIPAEDIPDFFTSLDRPGERQIRGFAEASEQLPGIRAIVKAHAGRLWIESAAGKSTTFYIQFPLLDTVQNSL